jgi:hypothetical protein
MRPTVVFAVFQAAGAGNFSPLTFRGGQEAPRSASRETAAPGIGRGEVVLDRSLPAGQNFPADATLAASSAAIAAN